MDSLGTFSLAQLGEDQSFSFEPAMLRYVALVPLSSYGGTEYALNEFEVYEPGDWTSLRPRTVEPAAATLDEAEPGDAAERPRLRCHHGDAQ